jgi:hypothetical protein
MIKPFLKRDLEMKITAQNGSLVIVLTKKTLPNSEPASV